MNIAILGLWLFAVAFSQTTTRVRRIVFIVGCVLGWAQIGQQSFLPVLGLFVLEELFSRFGSTKVLQWRFFPLTYAVVLIGLHHLFKLPGIGFSYFTLISAWNLSEMKFAGEERGLRSVSLFSFPKAALGPIASFRQHERLGKIPDEAWRLGIMGILKAYVLVNLWREFVPKPLWSELAGPFDCLWFGLWNYVNLYLEFSGTICLVASTLMLFGYNCPTNFDRPYLSVSITDFWRRWHMTLGAWIRRFIYIPLGGNRVSTSRIYVNLMICMLLSGIWHGIGWNYLLWGGLQGALMCFERWVKWEDSLTSRPRMIAAWFVTQVWVTASWVLFFSPGDSGFRVFDYLTARG